MIETTKWNLYFSVAFIWKFVILNNDVSSNLHMDDLTMAKKIGDKGFCNLHALNNAFQQRNQNNHEIFTGVTF